mgnify:CR=1 FL=1
MWTEEEMEIIKEFSTIITGKKSGRQWNSKRAEIARNVRDLIERYGDDGYGDKPKDMNRVEYWISHLALG